MDITLRPIKNADIKLMENWLDVPHVKKFYEEPQDWLHEIKHRKTEFSFIKHFIVLCEGREIGFCQYYDLTKSGESWYGKVPGGTYSIDYLIGEADLVGKCIGKEIIKLISEKAFYKAYAKKIVVQPEDNNYPSRGVLLANGFVYDEEKNCFVKEAPARTPQAVWDPWIGCKKYSEGCKNCYIYQGGEKRGINVSDVYKTMNFNAPSKKEKNGDYKYKSGTVFNTCFRSDFLIEEADEWRSDAYKIIKERSDCTFLFLTKRIDRFEKSIPDDWDNGYDNVIIGVSCENQKQVDYRLPILKSLPIKHKCITLSPLLEKVDISKYLDSDIMQVTAGGESGQDTTPCDVKWIEDLRAQCEKKNVTFIFKQTGSKLIKKGEIINVNYFKQHSEARNAKLNYLGSSEKFV